MNAPDANASPLRYALPSARALRGYTPGFQPSEPGWIKLNTNESPFGPSARVEEALRQGIGEDLRLYPDPDCRALRQAAASLHGVGPERIVAGNGSDELLALLARGFVSPDSRAAYPVPSYSLYPTLCCMRGSEAVEIPFGRDMRLPLERLAAVEGSLLFFTSPNAPTGVGFGNEEIRRLLEAFDGIVVIDEAYADFADSSAIELLGDFPNLVVTRSLSKSYGLAGLRLGYAIAHPDVAELLARLKDSYNVNRLSQAAGVAALFDQGHLQAAVGRARRIRDHYHEEFRALGWFVYRSQANFLFVEPKNALGEAGPEVAVSLYEHLRERKILVRRFPGHALTESFLRVTVGDEAQMLTLSEAIESWRRPA